MSGPRRICILVNVADILIAGRSSSFTLAFTTQLRQAFPLKHTTVLSAEQPLRLIGKKPSIIRMGRHDLCGDLHQTTSSTARSTSWSRATYHLLEVGWHCGQAGHIHWRDIDTYHTSTIIKSFNKETLLQDLPCLSASLSLSYISCVQLNCRHLIAIFLSNH